MGGSLSAWEIDSGRGNGSKTSKQSLDEQQIRFIGNPLSVWKQMNKEDLDVMPLQWKEISLSGSSICI